MGVDITHEAYRRWAEAEANSWPEDFDQENGCYENRCVICCKAFVGHKHRRICKVCSRVRS